MIPSFHQLRQLSASIGLFLFYTREREKKAANSQICLRICGTNILLLFLNDAIISPASAIAAQYSKTNLRIRGINILLLRLLRPSMSNGFFLYLLTMLPARRLQNDQNSIAPFRRRF